jgi:hypothetical protein
MMEVSGSVQIMTDPDPEVQKLTDPDPQHWFEVYRSRPVVCRTGHGHIFYFIKSFDIVSDLHCFQYGSGSVSSILSQCGTGSGS